MAYNELITIDNFPASNIGEISNLSADALSAQAKIVFANPITVGVNDFVLVGEKGRESSEIKKVQGVSGSEITFTSNLVNKHYKNEPLFVLRGDQAKVYKAPNVDGTEPIDGTYVILATLTLEGDQLNMTTMDTDGGTGYWYKYTFYNSVTTLETPLANAMAMRGGGYGHYATIDAVRQEAGLSNNRWITDQILNDKLLAAESEVNASLLLAGYDLPLSEVPAIVENATRLLAAGYILSVDYGPEYNGTNKDGAAKIKMGRDLLKSIEAGKPLATSTGIISGGIDGVVGYPDETTNSVGDENYAPRIFSINDKF